MQAGDSQTQYSCMLDSHENYSPQLVQFSLQLKLLAANIINTQPLNRCTAFGDDLSQIARWQNNGEGLPGRGKTVALIAGKLDLDLGLGGGIREGVLGNLVLVRDGDAVILVPRRLVPAALLADAGRGREDLDGSVVVERQARHVLLLAGRQHLHVPTNWQHLADLAEDGDAGAVPLGVDVDPLARGEVLVGRVEVQPALVVVVAGVLGQVDLGAVDAGLVDAADEQRVAKQVLGLTVGQGLVGPDLGVALVAPAGPALRRDGGQVALEGERVDVGDHGVAPLDGLAHEVGDARVHPGLDDVADGVVGRRGLEAVDGEARRHAADLDPAEQQLRVGLRALEAANVVAEAVDEREHGVEGDGVGAAHAVPAGGVVAAPRAAGVAHGAGRRAAGQHERPLVGPDGEHGVVRGLAVELGVEGAAPHADLGAGAQLGGYVLGHQVGLVQLALPGVVGDDVLVVVVPHAVDALLGQLLDAVEPPVIAGPGGEVDVAAVVTLTTAGTPELGDSRGAGLRVLEQTTGVPELLVLGVAGNQVGLDVGDQAHAVAVVLLDPGLGVGEAEPVPVEDVADLGRGVGHVVARGHLVGGAGDVVLLHLADEVEQGLAGGRVVEHGVLVASREVTKGPARHQQRLAGQDLGVGGDDVLQRLADDGVLLESAVVLAVDLVEAPHAVHLAADAVLAARVRGGEGGHDAVGRGVDEQRDVLVHGVGAVGVVAEAVGGGQLEPPARQVHGRRLLAQAHVQRLAVVARVVRHALAVDSVAPAGDVLEQGRGVIGLSGQPDLEQRRRPAPVDGDGAVSGPDRLGRLPGRLDFNGAGRQLDLGPGDGRVWRERVG
ncbi:hypothetical protein PoMZ_08839 [Pyricularia oryzae]|uniref:Uncharacterized protein n=1 Tax=Pyricularia oryzae TaxID=318829 RepID=A0A4P7NIM8_PYROR|nr:hypothetical protein PoMZ_08839 [Pyricularia oryzae]